jgi:hypothetical protein
MKPLEDGLEGILDRGKLPGADSDLGRFLSTHPEAKQEVTDMLEISRLIQDNFRVSPEENDELAPAPGFYARVMSRVEAEGAQQTFWSFFVDPSFTRRLAFASAAFALLMASILFLDPAQEPEAQFAQAPMMQSVDEPLLGAVLVSNDDGLPMEEPGDADETRGSALMQLTTYDQ